VTARPRIRLAEDRERKTGGEDRVDHRPEIVHDAQFNPGLGMAREEIADGLDGDRSHRVARDPVSGNSIRERERRRIEAIGEQPA
jgi:hypothetical protein